MSLSHKLVMASLTLLAFLDIPLDIPADIFPPISPVLVFKNSLIEQKRIEKEFLNYYNEAENIINDKEFKYIKYMQH